MIAVLLALSLAAAAPDRTAPPAVQPAVARDLAEPTWTDLSPTARLGVVTVPGVRKVEVSITVHAGSAALPEGPTPIASATGWLMDAAAGALDAAALAILEDTADLDVVSGLGTETFTVSVDAPREGLDRALLLLRDVLHRPTFPNAELKRWRFDQLNHLTVDAPTSPSTVASTALSHGWVPSDHPYGRRPDPAAIRRVTRGDLVALHGRLHGLGPVTVLVVGDVTTDDVRAPLAATLEGVGRPGAPADDLPLPLPTSSAVIAVDMPTEQAVIALRYAAPPREHPDRLAFEAADHALGGTFLSRLNANLREEHGFTYGIYSATWGGVSSGRWGTRVEVRTDNVGAALAEIRRELARMTAEGPTPVEISALVRERTADWNETLGTAASAASFYGALLERRHTAGEARARLEALATVTPEAARDAAAAWLDEARPHLWVIVGPRDAVAPQLEPLGLPVTWITPEQAVLGTFADPLERP